MITNSAGQYTVPQISAAEQYYGQHYFENNLTTGVLIIYHNYASAAFQIQ